MNNFELNSRAQELADTHDKYRLARKLIVAEEELAELRRAQYENGEAVGYVLPTGIKNLKKDHPATIYAPDNAMVPGSYPIWLYDRPPAPAAVPDAGHVSRFIRIMSEIALDLDGGNEWDDDPIPEELWQLYREATAPIPAEPDSEA